MSEKPILFSAPMVRAILAGTKTQTRRVVKPQPRGSSADGAWPVGVYVPPAQRVFVGDLLWVRETTREHGGMTEYVADGWTPRIRWTYSKRTRPAIHLPRKLSRITLRVTDVRVQRLQEISEEDAAAEGVGHSEAVWGEIGGDECFPCQHCKGTGLWLDYSSGACAERDCDDCYDTLSRWRLLWDSINVKRAPWASNPYVWAITFERVK